MSYPFSIASFLFLASFSSSESSSSLSSSDCITLISRNSSPSIVHAPPKGSALIQYSVSPFLKCISFGPNPIENSTTVMPLALAIIKCPNSWTITIILSTRIARITLRTNSYHLLSIMSVTIFCVERICSTVGLLI